MDTVITVFLPDDGRSDERFAECERIIRAYERLLSRTDADSAVSAFNQSQDGATVPAALGEIVEISLALSRATDGAFDLTSEPLTVLWNITAENPCVPDRESIDAALASVGYEKLTLTGDYLAKTDPGVHIDLGGVGKGSALGAVADYLRADGVPYGTVSFGGNIALIGQKPNGEDFRVGVKHPRDTDGIIGTLTLSGGYVAVSGDYERYFIADGVRYHHIFDPRTGCPAASGVQSVAVVCDDPTLADALSTALFVMGEQDGMAFYATGKYSFEAVFVTDAGVRVTDGLKNQFILKE